MNNLTRRVPRSRLLAATLLATAVSVGSACTATPDPVPEPDPVVLWEGHVDGPGIAYEDDAWDLHVHSHDTDTEYEPDEVVLGVSAAAETVVPADPAFSFLGSTGTPVWTLPKSHIEGLLSLGYAAEEIADGVLEGDALTLSLVAVDGPGSFHLYDTDGLGTPTVVFDSDEALPQALAVAAGAHVHANWAFSAPGTYTITYQVTGTPVGGEPVTSDPVAYTFEVAS